MNQNKKADEVQLNRALVNVNDVQDRLKVKNPALAVVQYGLKEALANIDDL